MFRIPFLPLLYSLFSLIRLPSLSVRSSLVRTHFVSLFLAHCLSRALFRSFSLACAFYIFLSRSRAISLFLSLSLSCFLNFSLASSVITGWRRLIGCLKLQVIFRNRATNYRAVLRKMTHEDKTSYDSTPPCISCYFSHSLYISCCILYLSLSLARDLSLPLSFSLSLPLSFSLHLLLYSSSLSTFLPLSPLTSLSISRLVHLSST